MNSAIFTLTLAAELLTTVAVAISIARPRRRIWPPRHPHSWGQPLMLILFFISGGGVILLGILDWDSLNLPVWVRVGAGMPLGIAGNGLALWAVATLGIASTAGEAGALTRRGPYRFSRNPQYVGFILALAGWALITNSALTLLVSLAGIIPLVLVPFAEEPWLLEKYGATYAEYRQAVPRFIGLKR